MSAALFSVALPDGTTFVARERVAAPEPVLGSLPNTEEGLNALRQYFFSRFSDAVRDKRPETERLRMQELYYSGFHWNTPELNRQNKVTNYCFAVVETIHPAMTENKPRPEIVLRRNYGDESVADALQDFATWLMDTSQFDGLHTLQTREKLKFGWCVHMVVVDPATGIAYGTPVSVFDYYKDATAEADEDLEHYFIARTVSTDWLKERFPGVDIQPDRLVSPGYSVYKQKYIDALGVTMGLGANDETLLAYASRFESQPPSGATTTLVAFDGVRSPYGRTTLLIQGFFRDRARIPAYYMGDIATKDEGDPNGAFVHTPSMKAWQRSEPSSPSGWRVVQFLGDGTFLGSHALDPCFGGKNVVIGRDYPQLGRYYGPGELDHIIPVNRSINNRYHLLNTSLEYEALPIGLLDFGAGSDVDKAALFPGDVMRKERGSEVKWMSFDGVAAPQFELLALEKQDIERISGSSDVQQGRRPAGIEAAAAIRSLQAAAQVRVRGKEVPAFIEYSALLKKLMVATGKKCKEPIWYRASDGKMKSMDPAMLLYEYDIRFAEGSGTAVGRADQEEKVFSLAGAGMIDTQTALERMGVKGIPQILDRLAQQHALQSIVAGSKGPPGGGPPASDAGGA